jgi:hypothetical protein
MLHITCDLCGRKLRAGEDHHVLKIEAFAAQDPAALTDADLDDDHMEAVSEMLREVEELDETAAEPEPANQHRRYDLCPACCRKYMRDPLGKEAAQKFDFSEN